MSMMILSFGAKLLQKMNLESFFPRNDYDYDKLEGPVPASPSPEGPNGDHRPAPSFGISPFSPWKQQLQ